MQGAVNIGESLGDPIVTWLPHLTLIFLLYYQPWRSAARGANIVRVIGLLLGVEIAAALMFPQFVQMPWLWGSVAILHFAWILSAYHEADNHHYLIGYWCIALAVAFAGSGADEAEARMAESARLLIAGCFGAAVIAKMRSKTFRNGSMFATLLMTDPRFATIAVYAGGATGQLIRTHRKAWSAVSSGEQASACAPFPSRLLVTARLITWWAVGIEALVAALYIPSFQGFAGWRESVLAVFVISTFAFVPVPAFGQILVILALAVAGDGGVRVFLLLLTGILPVLSYVPQFLERVTEMQRERRDGGATRLHAVRG